MPSSKLISSITASTTKLSRPTKCVRCSVNGLNGSGKIFQRIPWFLSTFAICLTPWLGSRKGSLKSSTTYPRCQRTSVRLDWYSKSLGNIFRNSLGFGLALFAWKWTGMYFAATRVYVRRDFENRFLASLIRNEKNQKNPSGPKSHSKSLFVSEFLFTDTVSASHATKKS